MGGYIEEPVAECIGTARIRHETTGVVYDIDGNDLEWECIYAHEWHPYQSTYEALYEHDDLGLLTWQCGWAASEPDIGSHELICDFKEYIIHEYDTSDHFDYDDLPTSPAPFLDYENAYEEAQELLKLHGTTNGDQVINKMIFTYQITIMEAYLADTIVNHVAQNQDIMTSLIEKDKILNAQKFSLLEIQKKSNFIKDTTLDYLHKIQYHRLETVQRLYYNAFRVNIFCNLFTDDIKNELFDIIRLRHQCTHRNGKDPEGEVLGLFTSTFVKDKMELIKTFVDSIEKKIKKVAS